MKFIIAIYESACSAVIRFFENRFLLNDEVAFLRLELEKERSEKNKLLNHILELNRTPSVELQNSAEFVPQQVTGTLSWDARRRQLEAESRNKAIELRREAAVAINSAKTTEELEHALLGED